MDSPDRVVPFIESVGMTLREMAGIEAAPGEPKRVADLNAIGDIAAVLALMAASNGYLVLGFPIATATALAQRVLDGATELNDTMIRDCVGELANVVAGQTKTLLFGTPEHFTLSTPTVVSGPPDVPAGNWWMVDFRSEVGPFRLCLRPPI